MKVTVEVSDMKISTKKGDSIVTYALGSCLGITVYDLCSRGGHASLTAALSRVSPEKAKKNPCMFVDTEYIPFEQAYRLGLKRKGP